MFNFSGKRPEALGVSGGRFVAADSDKPNWVSSQVRANDPHHIHPFSVEGERSDVMTRLIAVLLARPECTIVTQQADYIHAEFKAKLMGLVDDVEFYLPPDGRELHIRSASRLAYSDLGLNRARMEEIREAFDDAD